MPWNPNPSEVERDARLDPFRDNMRAAELLHEGTRVGLLACEVEHEWEQLGGRLWWAKWSPAHEYLYVYAELTAGVYAGTVCEEWLYFDEPDEAEVLTELGAGSYIFQVWEESSVSSETEFACEVRWLSGHDCAAARRSLLPHIES